MINGKIGTNEQLQQQSVAFLYQQQSGIGNLKHNTVYVSIKKIKFLGINLTRYI